MFLVFDSMENLDLKPNYYAIIPANVRYDVSLSPNAKLLYGEITSLANSKGYCWATNKYFMDLYDLSDRSIQRMLKQLSDKKYIRIEITENNTYRKIFLTNTPDKNVGGGVKKMSHTPDKNVAQNNIINNEKLLINYNWLKDGE